MKRKHSRLLGFGYKRRRGKDTAATMAAEYLRSQGCRCCVESFASPLKESIGRGVLGLTDEQLYGPDKERIDPFWGATPRWLLQHIGTDVMRNHFREDVWCRALERRVRLCDPDVFVLVSDVRFKNEADMLRELGGWVAHCERAVPEHRSDFHASEVGLDGYPHWDYQIDNNGSLEELRTQVQDIIRKCL